jgi:hypothetical protein
MVLFVAMFASCKQPAPPPATQPLPNKAAGSRDDVLVIPAQWDYTTRDEAGHDLIKGSFTMPLSLKQGERFAGSWQAKYVGPIDKQSSIGPQTGGGRLSGELNNDGQIVIELNPNMNDNNVRLLGKIDRGTADNGGHMTGTWTYSNFTGLANHGSFEATLQK